LKWHYPRFDLAKTVAPVAISNIFIQPALARGICAEVTVTFADGSEEVICLDQARTLNFDFSNPLPRNKQR